MIMAEQWGYQLAEQRKRLGFTQAGLAEIMGVTPDRVSQRARRGPHRRGARQLHRGARREA
ncbi:MAG TPA: helix-turn-helix transcriptional regulator [Bacillota bacterium]